MVSDIHGNLTALEAVIADLGRHAPDLVLQGGDLAVVGPRPAEVVDRIRELGWLGVVGNTDEMLWNPLVRAKQSAAAPKLGSWLKVLFEELGPWATERLGPGRIDWLRRLPTQCRAHEMVLVHAMPDDLWRAPMPDASDSDLVQSYGSLDARQVVYGHIHRPFVRKVGELTVANCGSVGMSWDGDWRPSYVLIQDGAVSVHRVEHDVERACKELVGAGFPRPNWLAAVYRTGRFTTPEPQRVVGP